MRDADPEQVAISAGTAVVTASKGDDLVPVRPPPATGAGTPSQLLRVWNSYFWPAER